MLFHASGDDFTILKYDVVRKVSQSQLLQGLVFQHFAVADDRACDRVALDVVLAFALAGIQTESHQLKLAVRFLLTALQFALHVLAVIVIGSPGVEYGNRMVDLAKAGREEAGATLQSELVETYYALRLAQRVVDVREQTFLGLQKHYRNAMKLEENGMINKAERLFAQVTMDEARRELESARKDLNVAQNALKVLLNVEDAISINPSSPLFMNHDLPDELYFKNLVSTGSYIVSKLRIQEAMADNQLKISKSAYIPTIALFGKQTLYAENLPKNLMPRTLVGVGFTWNIFDGLNREANIRQTRLTKQTLQLGREKAQNELGVLVDKLYSEIQNAKDDVAALNTTIEMSRELVRIRKKSFQEGMATSTDVIDAETMLSKVQIAFLLAYYKYDVALASLLSTCGMPESFWQYSRTGQTENFIFGK